MSAKLFFLWSWKTDLVLRVACDHFGETFSEKQWVHFDRAKVFVSR